MTRSKKNAAGTPHGKPKWWNKANKAHQSSSNSDHLPRSVNTEHFSLQDEARNTERHTSFWTTQTKLRYNHVNFVSAGLYTSTEDELFRNTDGNDIPPQEKAEESTIPSQPKAEMTKPPTFKVNPTGLSKLSANAVTFSPRSSPQIPQHSPSFQSPEKPKGSTGQLFVVDTEGHLPKVRQRSPPVIRPLSPANSDSSEEVVFRGRSTGKAKVVEDPVPTPASTFPPPSTGTNTVTPVSIPAKDPKDNKVTTSKPSWDDTAVEWEHRSKPGYGWAAPRAPRRVREDPPMLAFRTKEDKDDEEEILKDYINNMDPGDITVFQQRNLDLQLENGSVRAEFELLSVVEKTADSSLTTTEDESGNRVNNPKRKLRLDGQEQGEDEDNAESNDADSDDEDADSDDEDAGSDEDESLLDDMDLIERQRDKLDDEKIARLFAKQEELGITSDELLLYDDDEGISADVARAASKYSKNAPKKSRRSNNEFPAASLMADVLEQNPYGGFDIMNYERPSLRPKKKGRAGQLPPELSDEELVAAAKSSWEKDREKKKARKQEREELRSQGLLGKKNKFKPDLDEKYEEGMNIQQIEVEFEAFLCSSRNALSLPPMGKRHRKMVHELASVFNLSSKSTGAGRHRFATLSKNNRTMDWNKHEFYARARKINMGFFPRLDAQSRRNAKGARKSGGGGGGNSAGTKYRDGEIVGATAPEIGAENRGRAMLEKMGWSKGTALGAGDNKGILEPIASIVKNTRAGLG